MVIRERTAEYIFTKGFRLIIIAVAHMVALENDCHELKAWNDRGRKSERA